MGAVRERVLEAPVLRIENLPQAVGARRQIRQDPRHARAVGFGAQPDLESGGQVPRRREFLHALNVCGGGQPPRQLRAEFREGLRGPRQRHFGPGRIVAHPPPQPQFVRQPKHHRTEAHPLHPPAHPQQDGPFLRHIVGIYATPPPRSSPTPNPPQAHRNVQEFMKYTKLSGRSPDVFSWLFS